MEENGRDNLGRFRKGHIEDALTRKKRIESLKKSAKRNPNYLGELKKHPLYNIWRGFRFTDKGKKIGNSKEWDSFKKFYEDVLPKYEEGKRFNRIDANKPHSVDNFIFLTEAEAGLRHSSQKLLTYNFETKSLEEWAIELDLPWSGLIQRYYRGKKHNHSSHRILFGHRLAKQKEVKDYKELSRQRIRDKASKMIASYNNTDKKKGFSRGDLNIDWFIENVFRKSCHYCGDDNRLGVDRIDNNKSHSKDNVVPCCYECNIARGNNFTHKEMKIIGETIRMVKANRKNI